ncbi:MULTISPECIES: HlyD family efflux transporter periplasmic adaptor subunit [Afipia]|uniref:HlyD family efflux transporter periplasmic adaptor subunit n=1 Tax=Afipia clevelandensis TaxID=1034 RepID=UPI0009DB1923|nr:MAG: HlyD family efflux transporter periplasmic adaptor subunit [Bradyrhizobiaceae bacterium]
MDIRALQDGVVHQLEIHAVGGANANQPLMLIVPETYQSTVEAKVPSQDINQLRVGQPL